MIGNILNASIIALICMNITKSDKKVANKNISKLPDFKGIVTVKSAIKGRMRLNIPILKNNEALCNELYSNLVKIDSIKEISVNFITGSLLICYDENEVEPHLLQAAAIKLLNLDVFINDDSESIIGTEIKAYLKSLNEAVKSKTGFLFDIKTITAIILLMFGLCRICRVPRILPDGYTLCRWGIRQLL